MSKTNLPGFTAELALHRSSIHFQTASSSFSGSNNSVRPAMIDDNDVHCGNCVGGECAELHCFENWTHSGGGAGGPYGDGGGGGFGGGGGTLRSCRDRSGRSHRNGSTITTTIVRPPGGIENTYVIRERCNNGTWQDYGF